MGYLDELMQFLDAATCPVTGVDYAVRLLEEKGFLKLSLSDHWLLTPGCSYYVNLFGTGLCLFSVPNDCTKPYFRIAAAHTDSPCFKVKSRPDVTKSGCLLCNVEPYGGLIYDTWFDRPLGIAGRVAISDEKGGITLQTVDSLRPIMTIPNLCIHFQRGEQENAKRNIQKEMMPVFGVEGAHSQESLCDILSELCNVTKEQIVDYELYLYDTTKAERIGYRSDLLQSGRLDNLVSVYAVLQSVLETEHKNHISMGIFFDNEEVGSHTKQGADSLLLPMILEKLYHGLGYSHIEYYEAISNSHMLSVDAAHAVHPNYPEKSDLTNQVFLDSGLVIKMNSAQHYASDLQFAAQIKQQLTLHQIPYTVFYNHSNVRGGSTMGPMLSANLPMPTLDVGVGMLAMHSIRELCHTTSCTALKQALDVFYRCSLS